MSADDGGGRHRHLHHQHHHRDKTIGVLTKRHTCLAHPPPRSKSLDRSLHCYRHGMPYMDAPNQGYSAEDGPRNALNATTDNAEDLRLRRTVLLERVDGSYGFTLQSYGIQYGRSDGEVEVLTYVDFVEENGVAFKAGLRTGDVILSINGTDVERADHKDLVALIQTSTRLRMVVLYEDCARRVDLHMRYITLTQKLQYAVSEFKQLCKKEKQLLFAAQRRHSRRRRDKSSHSPCMSPHSGRRGGGGGGPTDPTLSAPSTLAHPQHPHRHQPPPASGPPPPYSQHQMSPGPQAGAAAAAPQHHGHHHQHHHHGQGPHAQHQHQHHRPPHHAHHHPQQQAQHFYPPQQHSSTSAADHQRRQEHPGATAAAAVGHNFPGRGVFKLRMKAKLEEKANNNGGKYKSLGCWTSCHDVSGKGSKDDGCQTDAAAGAAKDCGPENEPPPPYQRSVAAAGCGVIGVLSGIPPPPPPHVTNASARHGRGAAGRHHKRRSKSQKSHHHKQQLLNSDEEGCGGGTLCDDPAAGAGGSPYPHRPRSTENLLRQEHLQHHHQHLQQQQQPQQRQHQQQQPQHEVVAFASRSWGRPQHKDRLACEQWAAVDKEEEHGGGGGACGGSQVCACLRSKSFSSTASYSLSRTANNMMKATQVSTVTKSQSKRWSISMSRPKTPTAASASSGGSGQQESLLAAEEGADEAGTGAGGAGN